MKINSAKFFISNSDERKIVTANLPEIAFIGRSNVGKSSLINAFCNNQKLAHTSNTPGKTKLINHFIINEKWYLVDLPGYGYAKVSKDKKAAFEKLITNYILTREKLKCLFILIDARLEAQLIDIEFLTWCAENTVPFIIIFTKSDKLTKGGLAKNMQIYKNRLDGMFDEIPNYVVTSAESKMGIQELNKMIHEVLAT